MIKFKDANGAEQTLEMNRLYHADCMTAMAAIPDKFFELAIVDPPYGGGERHVYAANAHIGGGRPY